MRRNYLTNDNKSYIREIGKISAFRNYTPQVDSMRDSRDILRNRLDRRQKTGKSPKFWRLAIDKTSYIAHFSSKVCDCYKYDNNDLYMKLIPQNCTFQIRAPQFNWFSTSKVMTSFVKNVLVLELVSRVIASARKRGLADDGIFSICLLSCIRETPAVMRAQSFSVCAKWPAHTNFFSP